MALGISIDPSNSNLVKNKMITRLSTDRYEITAGVKGKNVYTFSSTGAVAGQSITFTTPSGISVAMVFASSLDDSGTKLRTNTLALSIANFILQVKEDMLTNYYLRDNYDITATSTTLTVEAKVAGYDFNTVSFCSATGISITSTVAGADAVLAENHRIRVDVLAEDHYSTNVYNKIATHEAEPIPGYADFDISTSLYYAFDRPDLPAFHETLVTKCIYALKRYKLICTEKYGNPAIYKKTIELGPYFAYFAGTSFQEFKYEQKLIDYFNTNLRYLTWQESGKNAWTDSQDYLYFAVPSGCTEFRVQVRAVYDDNTSSTVNPFLKTGVVAGEVYRIPVGYKNLDLVGGVFTVGKVVKYYDVLVDDHVTPATLASDFRFYMQYRDRYTRQTIIFNNSLPAMEILETTGELVTGVEVEIMTAENAEEFSTDPDQMIFTTYAEKADVFKVSTGWQTKERIDQIVDELLLAHHRYVADKEKATWIPIVINKGSMEKFKSNTQDLYAVNFEFAYAFRNKVHIGDVPPPAEEAP